MKIYDQQEQKQNHRYRECFDSCQIGGRFGEQAKKAMGLRNSNRTLARVTQLVGHLSVN